MPRDHGDLFNTIIANPVEVLFAQAVFMGLTIWIVQSGIKEELSGQADG